MPPTKSRLAASARGGRGRGRPRRARSRIVAEGDPAAPDAARAAGHQGRLVGLGQPIERAWPTAWRSATISACAGLELQHHAGVQHVLGGRAEMEMDTRRGRRRRPGVERAQRRHQRMLDAADLGGDFIQIDVGDLRLGGDLGRRRLRNDAELGLRQRQRGLIVEPCLARDSQSGARSRAARRCPTRARKQEAKSGRRWSAWKSS